MKERRDFRIELREVDCSAFDEVFHYLYQGKLHDVDYEDVDDESRARCLARLYLFSCRYEVEDLCDFLIGNLSYCAKHDMGYI
jgi:hypothetical protein